jgi:glycosyltransferase involved in cell wall biosynthesis
LRICIVDRQFYPVTKEIGSPVSMAAQYQAESFVREGHQVTVITGSKTWKPAPRRSIGLPFSLIEIWSARLPSAPGRILGDLIYSVRCALAVSTEVKLGTDIVFYHSHPALFLAELLGIVNPGLRKTAVSQHASLEQNDAHFIDVVGSAIKKFALPRTRLILTQSGPIKAELSRRFHVVESNIIVLPICAGIDTTIFKPDQPSAHLRAALGFENMDKMVLCVGSFSPGKNQMALLEAFAVVALRIPNAKLVLVGRVELESYYRLMLRFIEERPKLRNRIAIRSFVESYAELSEYYNTADVCALVVLEEGGLHRSLMEAMACGRACVVSRNPYNEEYVDPSEAVLVDPKNIASIADALIELLSNTASAESIGDAAHAKMLQYSWEALAKETLSWFSAIRSEDQSHQVTALAEVHL